MPLIRHIAFYTDDMERQARFYRDAFDLKEMRRSAEAISHRRLYRRHSDKDNSRFAKERARPFRLPGGHSGLHGRWEKFDRLNLDFGGGGLRQLHAAQATVLLH